MPQGENFWNPYRWIQVPDQPPTHAEPLYHHCMAGLSGRIHCTLTALTPLIIGDGRGNFVTHAKNKRPYIPATSLKGVIRSLAEIVGNTAVPFPKVDVDPNHQLRHARLENNGRAQLDITSRTFGYLNKGDVFAGLVQFGDAELVGEANPNQWPQQVVAVGQPKPSHTPFYPDTRRRKAYHHVPETDRLTGPHAGITQTTKNRPAPPGTRFTFTVDFRNLRDDELNLLLYCLALEDNVTVTLSKDALGPNAREPMTISGPMRHKVGGCKPHGGGSAHIAIEKMTIRTNPADRYRGRDSATSLEGDTLADELKRRIASFAARNDRTMQQVRAMMIYTPDDPRRPVNYPTYQWFQDDKQLPVHEKRQLKPTL
ncbi:MAG: hypothetical protein KatS3mg105_5133 [Gemmatales bacterium]|nr:MAG: hypothetical protein KatS3mg105_5133 [Gemmatales bacterium]GIW97855.1 MAG: hypothetical protein KatS3mg111_1188 [Pirellulaceae bacterium]